MTATLEDRLWEQLEIAAEREARRRPLGRLGAAGRAGLARPRLRPALAVLAGVVAIAIAVALIGTLDRPVPAAKPAPKKVETVHRLGTALTDAASGFGGFWVYDSVRGRVLRVDVTTHRVVGRAILPSRWLDAAVATGAGAVWAVPVTNSGHNSVGALGDPVSLVRIDPVSTQVSARVSVRTPGGAPLMPFGLVTTDNAVWIWGPRGALRVDPRTNRITKAIRLPGDTVKGFTANARTAWIATESGRLLRYDAVSAARTAAFRITPLSTPFPLVALPHAIVLDGGVGTVIARDPASGRVLWQSHLASDMRAAAPSGGHLWILTSSDTAPRDELVALDPDSGRATARIGLPTSGGRSLESVGSALWVTNDNGDVNIVHPSRK